MNDKINFISFSITDIQSTIRAIDVKIGILLAFTSFPLTKFPIIYSTTSMLFSVHWCDILGLLIIFSFYLFWALSIATSLRALVAIHNPSAHIKNAQDHTGIFYSGDQFKLNIIDSLLNRECITSKNSVSEQVARIPILPPEGKECTSSDYASELTFEQLKLVYIRDIKIFRFNWGVIFFSFWVILGLILFIVSR